jgi:hypothetical protein
VLTALENSVARLLVSVLFNHGSFCFHWLRGSYLLASFWQDFSRVKSFRSGFNPYYMICVPDKLKKPLGSY